MVMVAWDVLMMFQPSRSDAVRMVRWSDFTPSQPLIRAAKCPPRARVMLLMVRFLQFVIEMILSAWPDFGLPVMRWPPPSIVPPPVNLTFETLLPKNIALWKWLCPKSWNLSFLLGSGASYPLAEPVSVVPDGTLMVTLLCRCVVPFTARVPIGKVTVPPPALLAAAMALSIAGAASVLPSAFAPNDVTLKVMGAWVAALAIIGVANAARPTSPAAENPMSFVLLRTQALLPLSRTRRGLVRQGHR